MEEFINDFSIERIQSSDLVAFDRQKLLWMNGMYIRNTPTDKLWNILKQWAEKFDIFLEGPDTPGKNAFAIVDLIKDRMKLLSEYNSLVHYFYGDPSIDKNTLYSYTSGQDRGRDILKSFANTLKEIADSSWDAVTLDKALHELIHEKDFKPKEAFMTLRLALTGETATPQIFDIINILGKETVINRLNAALNL